MEATTNFSLWAGTVDHVRRGANTMSLEGKYIFAKGQKKPGFMPYFQYLPLPRNAEVEKDDKVYILGYGSMQCKEKFFENAYSLLYIFIRPDTGEIFWDIKFSQIKKIFPELTKEEKEKLKKRIKTAILEAAKKN